MSKYSDELERKFKSTKNILKNTDWSDNRVSDYLLKKSGNWDTCQGCGKTIKPNPTHLCSNCRRLNKEGAFDMPPIVKVIK